MADFGNCRCPRTMATRFSFLCTTEILNCCPLFKWSRGGYNRKIGVGGSRLGLQRAVPFPYTRKLIVSLYPDVKICRRGKICDEKESHPAQEDPHSFIESAAQAKDLTLLYFTDI